MKSIKEKAKEASLGYDEMQAPAISIGFVLGANYVLECIKEATTICFDEELIKVIEQLENKTMKCKDCNVNCPYRTSDGEKECEFQNHVIQAPDEWHYVRTQAAIVAMHGEMSFFGSNDYNRETIAEMAVKQADALIEELKKK